MDTINDALEMLDVVDQDDHVIGQATRQEVYAQGLRHRIVHVLADNEQDEYGLQLRSQSAGFCSGCWSTTAGGHVLAGETYRQGMIRESREELGSVRKLDVVGKSLYEAPGVPPKFVTLFLMRHAGPFTLHPHVERVEFHSMQSIAEKIAAGEPFHPELLYLMNEHSFTHVRR